MNKIPPDDLKSLIKENKHIKIINRMLIDIANTISDTNSLDKLYKSIYKSLYNITGLNNLFIVLHDPKTDLLNFVFYEDEKDEITAHDINQKSLLKLSNTYTTEVIRTGVSLMIDKQQFIKRMESAENERLTNTLFKISNAVNKTDNLKELYQYIHKSLNNIMDLTNFSISLYNNTNNTISFPYYIDEFDKYDEFDVFALKNNSLSSEVFQAQKPVLLKKADLDKKGDENKIAGTKPLIWIGIPLMVKSEVKGLMVAQSYSDPHLYNQRDVDILNSVSEQIAIAIDRKQSEEALYQNKEKIKKLSEQTEQFSLVAASVISLKKEKEIYEKICTAITSYSDFKRVIIVSF